MFAIAPAATAAPAASIADYATATADLLDADARLKGGEDEAYGDFLAALLAQGRASNPL